MDIIKERYLAQKVNIPIVKKRPLIFYLQILLPRLVELKGCPLYDKVHIEYDIKAKPIRKARRKLYKRADMDGLQDHMARFRDSFLSSDLSHMSVNDFGSF